MNVSTRDSTRYRCCVDNCGWYLDDNNRDFSDVADSPFPLTSTETVGQAARRIMTEQRDERESLLRQHLESHDVLRFVLTIQRLRQALGEPS